MQDPIVQEGAAILREKAKALKKNEIASRKIRGVISRMKKILAAEEYGVAIAAPQVGESIRMFVVAGKVFLPEDAPKDAKTPPDKVFINPEITRLSKDKREMAEGCLSVRGKYGTVLRHERASVKALNEKGEPFTYNGTGLLAHIFQHECDHLEGVLYIDKATKLTDDKPESREKLREEYPA